MSDPTAWGCSKPNTRVLQGCFGAGLGSCCAALLCFACLPDQRSSCLAHTCRVWQQRVNCHLLSACIIFLRFGPMQHTCAHMSITLPLLARSITRQPTHAHAHARTHMAVTRAQPEGCARSSYHSHPCLHAVQQLPRPAAWHVSGGCCMLSHNHCLPHNHMHVHNVCLLACLLAVLLCKHVHPRSVSAGS
jgi:hypothetical protein